MPFTGRSEAGGTVFDGGVIPKKPITQFEPISLVLPGHPAGRARRGARVYRRMIVRIRYSIAGLMTVVLLIALGLAGLRDTSTVWASAVFSLTVILLATAILGAATCSGPSRMACLGFGLFGGTYLLAAFWLWPVPNGVTAPPLLSKLLLDWLQPSVKTPTVMTIDRGQPGELSFVPIPNVWTTVPGTVNITTSAPFTGRVINLHNYRRIGHVLASIMLGCVGAWLGTNLSAWSEGVRRSPDP